MTKAESQRSVRGRQRPSRSSHVLSLALAAASTLTLAAVPRHAAASAQRPQAAQGPAQASHGVHGVQPARALRERLQELRARAGHGGGGARLQAEIRELEGLEALAASLERVRRIASGGHLDLEALGRELELPVWGRAPPAWLRARDELAWLLRPRLHPESLRSPPPPTRRGRDPTRTALAWTARCTSPEREAFREDMLGHARRTMEELAAAVVRFWGDRDRIPALDLSDLLEEDSGGRPFVPSDEVPLDPWGHPYRLEHPPGERAGVRLRSAGPDGVEGTHDDLLSEPILPPQDAKD